MGDPSPSNGIGLIFVIGQVQGLNCFVVVPDKLVVILIRTDNKIPKYDIIQYCKWLPFY
jgi:hypothetical protein